MFLEKDKKTRTIVSTHLTMKRIAQVYDIEIRYDVIHRDIQCPRLEFKTGDLNLIVPLNYQDSEYLIKRHKKWIYNHAKFINAIEKGDTRIGLDKKRTDDEFKKLVTTNISASALKLGVYPKKVTIKEMKSRWGSCNSYTGHITLCSHLRYLPENIIKYVIFHEVTHLLRRNHDKDFWELISGEYPDYKNIRKDLWGYWYLIQTKISQKKDIVKDR